MFFDASFKSVTMEVVKYEILHSICVAFSLNIIAWLTWLGDLNLVHRASRKTKSIPIGISGIGKHFLRTSAFAADTFCKQGRNRTRQQPFS